MADLSELVITGAQKSAENLGQNVAQGAELAMKAEQIQMQKQKIQQEAKDLSKARFDKFVDALQKGANYQGTARSNYYNKIMPQYRDSLGLTDNFPDEMIKFATADDQQVGRLQSAISLVRAGEMAEADFIKLMNDPVSYGDLTPETKENFYGQAADAAKVAIDAKARSAALTQGAAQFQQGQSATAQRDRSDRKEKLDKIVREGGFLDAESDLNTLNAGIPGGIKGWKGGQIAGISGDQGKMPSSELSGQAAQNRQALQRLVNIKLKQMSGSAVMDQELARNLEALGVSTTYLNGSWTSNLLTGLKKPPSPEKVLQGIRYLERSTKNEIRKLKNTYGPDVYNEVTSGTETGSLAVKPGAGGEDTAPGGIGSAITAIQKNFPDPTKIDKARLMQSLSKKYNEAQISEIMTKLGVK